MIQEKVVREVLPDFSEMTAGGTALPRLQSASSKRASGLDPA